MPLDKDQIDCLYGYRSLGVWCLILTQVRGGDFRNNKADSSETFVKRLQAVEKEVSGGVMQQTSESATEDTGGCAKGSGGAICLGLSNIPLRASVEVSIEYTVFGNNSAEIGGMYTAAEFFVFAGRCCISEHSWF